MTKPIDLPVDVIDALHAGRKIEAIKLLRKHRGIDLKEAKDIVDAYARENDDLIVEREDTGSLTSLMVLILVFAIAYFFLS